MGNKRPPLAVRGKPAQKPPLTLPGLCPAARSCSANTQQGSVCHCEERSGNPFSLRQHKAKPNDSRRIRNCLRICPISCQLARLLCGDADCHVVGAKSAWLRFRLAAKTSPADAPPSSACHCVLRSCNRSSVSSFCMSLRGAKRRGNPFSSQWSGTKSNFSRRIRKP